MGNTMRRVTYSLTILATLGLVGTAVAQRGSQVPASARDSAPIDLTGTWVSVVSEDWRHRMATPRRGDYESLPLNDNGRRAADAWDLETDNAAGDQCRAFGVGGIMRQPGRLRIGWENEDTLRIDFDAGTQTRLLNFDPTLRATGEPTWQGHSFAEWERPPGGPSAARAQIGGGALIAGGGGRGQRGGPAPADSIFEGGSLKVTTTNFRSGYLRKNGVPYSEDASITEYFHRLPRHPNGDVWLHVVTIIEDPIYLTQPFYTSTQFKLEPNDRRFSPRPCRTPPPPP
jgi:hypothetical protein